MYARLFLPSHVFKSIAAFFLFVFIIFPTSNCNEHGHPLNCSAHLFSCGTKVGICFPFWVGEDRLPYCRLPQFELKCHNDGSEINPTIDFDSRKFRVIQIQEANKTITVAPIHRWDDFCTRENFRSINFSVVPFTLASGFQTLTFYPDYPAGTNSTSDRINYFSSRSFSSDQLLNLQKNEHHITIPVHEKAIQELRNVSLVKLQEIVKEGFQLKYSTHPSNGTYSNPAPASSNDCSTTARKVNSKRIKWKVIVGVCTAVVTIILMSLLFFFYYRWYKKRHAALSLISRNTFSYLSSTKDDEADTYLELGVHLFTYSELEEATGNFDSKNELGDGGFGTVYKGKLRDGRDVAVKRLYENNYKRVEQFMNEVEILARLRHRNLVSLYGCTSHHSRELLLVYEYVSNGTVADHLHGEEAKPGSLAWKTRLNIAVETASALVYLHASDVVHRDVKTDNILLDNNFCVKVADFGLSRLFPTNAIHISTAPQGTPGYVDPEYHQCYQLTNKSDVFSFGVVLVELISSKPAVDITRHRHEINLSNMAINKIQSCALHELVDPCLGFDSDHKTRGMITDVAELAFLCLQSMKDLRPSMTEAFKALEGIQNKDYKMGRAEKGDNPAGNAVLLKSDPPTVSPDSVTANWASRSSTPNISG